MISINIHVSKQIGLKQIKCRSLAEGILNKAVEHKKYERTDREREGGRASLAENLLETNKLRHYSRTSMAQTLMARLPRFFRTLTWVPWNKSHSCRFRII